MTSNRKKPLGVKAFEDLIRKISQVPKGELDKELKKERRSQSRAGLCARSQPVGGMPNVEGQKSNVE